LILAEGINMAEDSSKMVGIKDEIEIDMNAENLGVNEYITVKQPQLILSGHGAPIMAADWLNSGESIASVSWDNSVILWDAEEGKSISTAQNSWVSFLRRFNCLVLWFIY
jgi:WD40 repeat protein